MSKLGSLQVVSTQPLHAVYRGNPLPKNPTQYYSKDSERMVKRKKNDNSTNQSIFKKVVSVKPEYFFSPTAYKIASQIVHVEHWEGGHQSRNSNKSFLQDLANFLFPFFQAEVHLANHNVAIQDDCDWNHPKQIELIHLGWYAIIPPKGGEKTVADMYPENWEQGPSMV